MKFSHLGNPYIKDMAKLCAKYPNAYSDMSGLFYSKTEPDQLQTGVEDIKLFLSIAGTKKLLFGTDFPVQTHEDSVALIEKAMVENSEEDRTRVYYGNAQKLLKLKDK